MAGLKCLVISFHLLVLFLGSLSSPAKSIDENLASPPPLEPPASIYNVSVHGFVYCLCKVSSNEIKYGIQPARTAVHHPLPDQWLDYRTQFQGTTSFYKEQGARVHLQCDSLSAREGKTDDEGRYSLKAQFPVLADQEMMYRFVEKQCKVYVASTPVPACNVPESLGPERGVDVTYVGTGDDGANFVAVLKIGPDGCHKE